LGLDILFLDDIDDIDLSEFDLLLEADDDFLDFVDEDLRDFPVLKPLLDLEDDFLIIIGSNDGGGIGNDNGRDGGGIGNDNGVGEDISCISIDFTYRKLFASFIHNSRNPDKLGRFLKTSLGLNLNTSIV
jgi:hypothetical protein